MRGGDQSFNDRVARIRSGQQFEADNLVGAPTMQRFRKTAKRRERQKQAEAVTLGGAVREVFILPFALISGLLAVLAARLAWFHLSQNGLLPTSIADFGIRGEAMLATISVMFFIVAFKLRRGLRIWAVLAGFFFMAFGENAFAQTLPGIWQAIFSPDYTAQLGDGMTLASLLPY